MRFMNHGDIDEACERFAADPILGPAARYLAAWRDTVDAHSDGWAYWRLPVDAARELIELVDGARMSGMGAWPRVAPATLADVERAILPIRAFHVSRGAAAGLALPELGAVPVDRAANVRRLFNDWRAGGRGLAFILPELEPEEAARLAVDLAMHALDSGEGAGTAWAIIAECKRGLK